ncbi:MAG TPA: adenylosuccinate lyase [Chryseolinea sp.]|nr:adenylosuccinate lyase [Chryseolinea sp.]
MELNPLTAISPIDGRYFQTVNPLTLYFSEFALMKYRIQVEIEYIIALSGSVSELDDFPAYRLKDLRGIFKNFTEENAEEIKEIERTTNHDVKAVEYFIKKQFDSLKLEPFKEFVHFGLTSQDINNTAIPLLLKNFMDDEYFPKIGMLLSRLNGFAKDWKDVPMLAHTHGQPASPTRVGKEIMVFAARLEKQLNQVKVVPVSAKFGGATGNLNAHYVAYPSIDWNKFADDFCNHLGLVRSFPTTQIEHYDNMAALFDSLKRVNTILIDLCRDLWQYISMEYFKQKIKEGEVGSSAMPHKVNPIDFENAEGNLGFANAIFEFLSAKLPISRLQRDLTDSTVLRNIGVPIAHTYIAIQSIMKGLGKLELNEVAIRQDLENNWAVVAEAIQTILRKEGYPNPYEALKTLTRKNEKITQQSMSDFIDGLAARDEVKKRLRSITPFTYVGG